MRTCTRARWDRNATMRCGTGPLQRQAPSEGERLIGKEQASCLERPGRTCTCWTGKTETPVGSTRQRRKAHRHGALCHMRDSKGRASTGLGACRGSARKQGCRRKAERLLGSEEASCEKESCRRQAAEHARARSWKILRRARNKGSEESRRQRVGRPWRQRGQGMGRREQ